MPRYHVPKATVRVETRVSNSRFISTIERTDTVAAAQAFIKSQREEMPDANHHVYAFRIGFGNSVSEGMSDDGEPSGTSGPPTLAVLRGSDIGDVAIVTTRYFGGTKLGTGGLVAAYTAAAQAAFKELQTEEKVERIQCNLTVPYNLLERVKLILAEQETEMVNEHFEADVTLTFTLPMERYDALNATIRDLTAGRIALNKN